MVSLSNVRDFISFILSPPLCSHCKKKLYERSVFCEDCMARINPIVSYNLQVKPGRVIPVHALSGYNEFLRPLILSKRSKNAYGCHALAELMWKRTRFLSMSCDYLVPIPLHWTRRLTRGFNQAEEMANFLAQKRGVSIAHLLNRSRKTSYQADVPIQRREKNVERAFLLSSLIDPALYQGKHLILVDDLMTTGSTLKYAAQELALLKPASISALVGCRAI